MINVGIFGQYELIRAGIEAILSASTEISVKCATERFSETNCTGIDVALVEGNLVKLHSPESIVAMFDEVNETRPALLSLLKDPSRTEAAFYRDTIRHGFSGIITISDSAHELLAATCAAAAGQVVGSQMIMQWVTSDDTPDRSTKANLEKGLSRLTKREAEIVRLVATGSSNADIAELLFIGESTAKTHLNRAMAKLNVSSRANVVAFAYEAQLVSPNECKSHSPAADRMSISRKFTQEIPHAVDDEAKG